VAAGLQSIAPRGRLHRVAHAPDPWAWPDWSHAAADGTFGNRYDDPQSVYRVLYASSDRLGAFVEVLARFRPDPHVVRGLREIRGDDARALAPGELDASWLERRRLGEALVRGRFADIGHSRSLARLRRDLAPRIRHHRLSDLDAAAIRLSAPRRFTQEVSRYVYEQTATAGRRAFDGIAYLSRLGDELRNWAIFEPAASREVIRERKIARIAPDDPDLVHALAMHGITLVRRR
jgi:hypothetical protein